MLTSGTTYNVKDPSIHVLMQPGCIPINCYQTVATMAKKGKKEKSDRTAEEIGMDVISAMDLEFHDSSDRVVAVTGAAYIDVVLEELLRKMLSMGPEDSIQILEPTGALGSYGMRCDIAFRLRLIPRDQFEDLKLIGRIRNDFAHKYKCSSFESQPICDLCNNLKQPTIVAEMPSKSTVFPPEVRQAMSEYARSLTASPREKYTMTVISLCGSLLRRVKHLQIPTKDTWFPENPDPDMT